MKSTVAVLVAGMSLCAAAPSSANDSASVSIRVQGVVHTICRVEFANATPTVTEGVADLGQMTELCNDADGYTVTLTTPAGLTGAVLYIDGVPTPVSPDGHTVVVDSGQPVFRQRQVKLDLGSPDVQLASLSIQAQPKGMIY